MINANNKHYKLQYQCLSDSLLPTLQMDHLKFRYFVQKLQGPKTVAVDSTAKPVVAAPAAEAPKH